MGLTPNLDDYDRVRATFTWAAARAELEGLPDRRGLNIAHEAVDRHAAGPRGGHVAIRWLGKRGDVHDYTYRDLRELTDRFANVPDLLVQAPLSSVELTSLYVLRFACLRRPLLKNR